MLIRCYCDGNYDHSFITVDGERLDPARSQAVRNHSPGGFAWGYAGSGPSQLALAILLASGIPEDEALRVYQEFKFEFITDLPQDDGWELDIDIERWVSLNA